MYMSAQKTQLIIDSITITIRQGRRLKQKKRLKVDYQKKGMYS